MSSETRIDSENSRRFSGAQVASIALLAVVATAIIVAWVIPVYLFPDKFRPVQLNDEEHAALVSKLERIGIEVAPREPRETQEALVPEPYSEADANRDISLSEKELNALIATNTELGTKLAIDLADDLASAKLLIPMDPEFPMIGGKTLRVHAGLELAYAGGQPSVVLKGISVMGIPIPNAWIGNLKNVDLVQQYGGDAGFWKTFADGVDQIRVDDGRLFIRLRE